MQDSCVGSGAGERLGRVRVFEVAGFPTLSRTQYVYLCVPAGATIVGQLRILLKIRKFYKRSERTSPTTPVAGNT